MDSHKFQKLFGGLLKSRVLEKELFLLYIESIKAPLVGFKLIPVCLIETFVKKNRKLPIPILKTSSKSFFHSISKIQKLIKDSIIL